MLLLKYSTWWFRLYSALDKAHPSGTLDVDVKETIRKATEPRTTATHWWTSVVWATAAVALHNVQQIKGWSDKLLRLEEDPLAYLGILVDILQEWDRHFMRQTDSIDSGRRGINSGDVHIGKGDNGRIRIIYECRDETHVDRETKMKGELGRALDSWENLIELSFARADRKPKVCSST